MASRRGEISKKARLEAILAERRPALVDPSLCDELKAALAPVSDSYLHQLLRSSGLALHLLVEGASLHSTEDLRRTLLGLAELYELAPTPEDRRKIRARVIESKTRLRSLIARAGTPELRAQRQQMHEELMTWLENPPVFGLWLELKCFRV